MKKCPAADACRSCDVTLARAVLRALRSAVSAPGLTLARDLVLAVALQIAASSAHALPGAAPAYELHSETRDAALALVREAAAALAPADARIVAQAGVLDARLRLAPCARVQPHLVAGLPVWGTTRVGLRCVAGAVAWRAWLPVAVQVLAPAWTSKAVLPAGALVVPEQWLRAEADWAAAPSPPVEAGTAIAGRTLARPVAAGQVLREADLQARRWFTIGQSVRIVAVGAGYRIDAEGQALGHGIEGRPVRVRTDGGRIVTGVAVGEALVEVRQ